MTLRTVPHLRGSVVLLCTTFPASLETSSGRDAREIPGGCLLADIAALCRQAEAEFHVWDGEGAPPKIIPDLILSEMACGVPLIHSVFPLARKIIFSLESPVQAKRFHLNLKGITKEFDAAYVFRGLLPFCLARRSLPITFPLDRAQFSTEVMAGWSKRTGIGYVGSPKSIYHFIRGGRDRTARGLVKDLIFLGAKVIVKPFGGRELYARRLEFAVGAPEVTIYGRGWETALPAGSSSILGGSPEGVTGKLTSLRRHRFALCLENYAFPGYVTEKIADAIAAGAVPIYQGDPEIERYVPREALIDATPFKDARELGSFLSSITEERWNAYTAAGRRWVGALAGRSFFSDEIATQMLAGARAP